VEVARVVDGYRVWGCKSCGLYWVPGVSDEVLTNFYGSQYFNGSQDFGYADYLANEGILRLNARTLLEVIDQNFPGKTRADLKLLDVGCAHGFLVDEACKIGYDAEGIDSSALAAEYGRTVLNRHVQVGMIGSAQYPADHFDVVTSVGSIEHLSDAVQFVEDVARITKPGGLLLITTVDTKRFMGIYRFKPPEHLYYFSRDNLTLLLNSKGYDVVRLTGNRVSHALGEALGILGKALFSRWFDTDVIVRRLPFQHVRVSVPNNEMLVVARKRQACPWPPSVRFSQPLE